MLYWLLYQKLFRFYTPLRVFRFLTFRTAFAGITALFIALALGPWLINRLKQFQIGQFIREDGPQSHLQKAGTPTMGGVLINIAILVPTLLWADLTNPFIWIAIFSVIAFGAIGFVDDFAKLRRKRNLGLTSRQKLLAQALVGVVIALILVWLNHQGRYSTRLVVPFFKNYRPNLAFNALTGHPSLYLVAFLPFIAFVVLVVVGSSNAVNLTDGLDGLAIGCTIIAAGALTVLTYISGHALFATYLEIEKMPQVGELTIFGGAMVGASIGFLWYNAHPAEIFMGDVGSLALGGAIGTVAILIKQELLLPFIGGIFVLEAVSVILQVGSYKLRHKRIFKMAPIHHHFEHMGWSESKIITRFWILAGVFALFALTTLKLR
ncbi:MAG TPA: phospho-N-acetylmuramoyl-pentapeptide-transferase [Terriglobales bacterium]|nr:phospho-N-acetylmuramoyl-pentapeptide-transferase [Terriglobales bacterium]